MKSLSDIHCAQSLEAVFRELIPITRDMGFSVKRFENDELVIGCPLAPNINHQGSAFGGSLFSAAALIGWGLIQLKLAPLEIRTNTVAANGDVRFLRPVFTDFECICQVPEDWPAFEKKLREQGRASLTLMPRIVADGETAMTVSARYVTTRLQP